MAQPAYGGTNGVALLDIGQKGGVRNNGGLALATMGVNAAQEKITTVQQAFPQQNFTVQDLLGFKGLLVTWNGTLWVIDATELQSIESDVEQYKAGRYRDPLTGEVTFNLDQMKPTRLTRSVGKTFAVLSEVARLVEYKRIGPRQTVVGNPYTVMQVFEIVFRILT